MLASNVITILGCTLGGAFALFLIGWPAIVLTVAAIFVYTSARKATIKAKKKIA